MSEQNVNYQERESLFMLLDDSNMPKGDISYPALSTQEQNYLDNIFDTLLAKYGL
ncbi:MAG: hypothetical protein J6M62_05465 [Selenomonadaceae bacterium]|nr:hypothetical protein [Selenomonadaceae bacterium]